MASTSMNEIARAIYLASKDKNGFDQSTVIDGAVKFLWKRRLLSRYPEVISKLEKIIDREEGRIIAKVWSVEKLDDKLRRELVQSLKKRYSTGEIQITEKIDKKLLGGFRIEINDEVIDLSVKNKIGKLKEYLTKSA